MNLQLSEDSFDRGIARRLPSVDVAVIGGGFFGLRLALLARRLGREVVLFEASDRLMGRASRYNQARVHAGYHYPRAFVTARRSAVGSRAFEAEYADAIDASFRMVYAIAARESLVTLMQFERLAEAIGAPVVQDEILRQELFDPRHVAAAYPVREVAFNPDLIRERLARECQEAGVEIRMQTRAEYRPASGMLQVTGPDGEPRDLAFRALVAAAYGAFGHLGIPAETPVDLQMTELCLVDMPGDLKGVGVTIMDGPFFSCMPWPARPGLHSLSHVAFTPHRIFRAGDLDDPYAPAATCQETEFRRMIQASARLMPRLAAATYQGSHHEMKALPRQSAHIASRPIVWEVLRQDPRVVSVLGSKLDTIYDAECALREFLDPHRAPAH